MLTIIPTACGLATSRDCKIVSERGAKDAADFVARASSMSEMELENFLLQIRANEQEYRSSGKDNIADAYIEAFESTLAAKNDSLAFIILGNRAAKISKDIAQQPAQVATEADSTNIATRSEAPEEVGEAGDLDDETPEYELDIK
jgi:hypothetical protein